MVLKLSKLNLVYQYIYIDKIKERELKQTQKKKKTKKKKIARPALFISDSSDNEIANN